MAPTELHMPVETFLDVVWPYDKLWKCSPDNFLSNAPTLVVIRQLQTAQTFLVQKVQILPKKKTPLTFEACKNVITWSAWFFYLSFLEIDLSNLGILNHFHIIIEPAFNLNKTKIYFSACLQNSRHFEFQISSTQGKFLDFSQKRFFSSRIVS